MQQGMLSADRDLVRLDRAGAGIDDGLALSTQPMPDPRHPDLANAQHPGCRAQSLLHLVRN